MKSRLAITAILALGLLTGGTGAGLAISGSSENGSAAQVQYPDSVGGQQEGGAPPGEVLGGAERQEGAPTPAAPTPGAPTPAQPTRQVQAAKGGDELPFTGLAAIPLILLGVALLGGGLLLQRSARRADSS